MNIDTCPTCGNTLKYNDRYDSHYCEVCNAWIEQKCGDHNCVFCKGRPNRPLDKEYKNYGGII